MTTAPRAALGLHLPVAGGLARALHVREGLIETPTSTDAFADDPTRLEGLRP
ncbi:MAG TPA: hypothetical protein VK908_06395 [Jiangellales bacterium]|nr:hypothetical protein [Jiangellales bacterium]